MEALDLAGSDKEEAEFASLLFRLCCNVCAHRSMGMQCYSVLPPGIFAMLRKRDAVAAALQELKAMWQVITDLEVLANANPALAFVMRNVPFLLNPVVRDIFVLLSQHGFLLAPPAVTKMLRTIFDGFCQTVLVERAFQKLQDRRRLVRNNKIRRMKRFYHIHSSGLLGEMGRREVGLKSGPLPSSMPRVVPKTRFEAKGLPSSIPDKEFAPLRSGKKTWLSLSAQGLQLQVAAWALLKEVHGQGQVGQVGLAWRALLAVEGSVVRNKEQGEHYIVFKASQFAMMLWPADCDQVAQRVLFKPSTGDRGVAFWRVVLHTSAWEVLPAEVVPPAVLAA